jgi:4-aminobutyrate aminotransferase-like enzyme
MYSHHQQQSYSSFTGYDYTSSAYPASGTVFTSGKGVYLFDRHGNNYLDACAGTFNIGLGYGNKIIIDRLKQQMDTGLIHLSSSFASEAVNFAEQALVDISPKNISKCHLKGCTGGSTAIEQAIRHAWVKTSKKTLITFRGSHHGQTISTTFVSGMPFRKNRLPISPLPTLQVNPPDCYRCPYKKTPSTCGFECIDEVENVLQHPPTGCDDVAAFIAEPILGAGGGITPPHQYWMKLSSVLSAKGILLIFDEVQTFGRTGHFFAAQYYNVEPNLIAIAKGISGIGIPGAGALLMEDGFNLLNGGERSLTWGANLLSCAAISSTVELMKAPSFLHNLKNTGELLADRLNRLASIYDFIGTVRGFGLMTGLEIVATKASRKPRPDLAYKILKTAHKNRLIIRLSEYDRGNFVKIRPSLNITSDEVLDLCDRLAFTLKEVHTTL